ncbi:MAG: hypothetical protein ABSD31_07240, partial [Candidatus Binataceae bacterium]
MASAKRRWWRRASIGLALCIAVALCGCAAGSPQNQVARGSIQQKAAGARPRFDWPVSGGVVSSGFGMRHGAMHDGIDIAAPVGTPVH